jgi:hypothetical protein
VQAETLIALGRQTCGEQSSLQTKQSGRANRLLFVTHFTGAPQSSRDERQPWFVQDYDSELGRFCLDKR